MDSNSKGYSNNPKIKSFLESLRNRSISPSSTRTESLTPPFSLENYQEKRKLENQRKQEFFRSRTREFNEVYSLKKRQEENKVSEIRRQLIQLAKSMKKLQKDVDIAVIAPIEEPSQYQFSFLEHLKYTIDLLKRQVESTQTWLHVFNSRKSKQSYYWSNAKSSGTKFTLSEERQIATSIG